MPLCDIEEMKEDVPNNFCFVIKRGKAQYVKYVENLLKTYDLDSFKNKYPKELSGGMKQRVV